MRATYTHQRGRRSGRRGLLVATGLVAVLVIADLGSGGAIRSAVRSVGAAAGRVGQSAAAAVAGSGIGASSDSLEAQVAALKAELATYQGRAAAYQALQSENGQLRALSGLSPQVKGIAAPIVSSIISSPYGTLLVGAGTAEGVQEGDLALAAGGFVVGSVTNVSAHTATITELFAPDAAVNAVLDNASVVLTGTGGGNANTLVPHGVVVNAGDVAVAPSLGQRPVGIVGAIASSSAAASSRVYVRLPVSLASLQYVYVIPAH